MKKLFLLLIILPQLTANSQQPAIIIGEKQNMRFTDIVPDFELNCSWTTGSGCGRHINLDADGDGSNDLFFDYSYGECNMSTLTMIFWNSIGNTEIISDSLSNSFFYKGDTLYAGANHAIKRHYTPTGQDSLGLPTFDTTFLPIDPYWHNPNSSSGTIALYGCFAGYYDVGWTGTSDTNYFAFRIIQSADTAYGWVKTHCTSYGRIMLESFAISGDTGSFVFTGTEELAEEPGDIKVYPNPVAETLTVETPFENYRCEIFSLDGKNLAVLSANEKRKSIDVSGLSSGLYFINLSSEGQTITKRFIKE